MRGRRLDSDRVARAAAADRVSPRTRKAVLAAARRHHYITDGLVGSLASRRSEILGLVIPTIMNSIYVNGSVRAPCRVDRCWPGAGGTGFSRSWATSRARRSPWSSTRSIGGQRVVRELDDVIARRRPTGDDRQQRQRHRADLASRAGMDQPATAPGGMTSRLASQPRTPWWRPSSASAQRVHRLSVRCRLLGSSSLRRGDVARTLFYMDLRYDGSDSGTPNIFKRSIAPPRSASGTSGICARCWSGARKTWSTMPGGGIMT